MDDRNVIAFANPMYDDQSTIAPQPVYDGASGRGDDGLYDEPAFTASQRANPVYQSTEDIAGVDLNGAFTPGCSSCFWFFLLWSFFMLSLPRP